MEMHPAALLKQATSQADPTGEAGHCAKINTDKEEIRQTVK
jgi:hypothetical protein